MGLFCWIAESSTSLFCNSFLLERNAMAQSCKAVGVSKQYSADNEGLDMGLSCWLAETFTSSFFNRFFRQDHRSPLLSSVSRHWRLSDFDHTSGQGEGRLPTASLSPVPAARA